MDRRRFLQTVAASAAAAKSLGAMAAPKRIPDSMPNSSGTIKSTQVELNGHTLICTFTRKGETWKVYEDLRTRDGAITFLSSSGVARILPKSAEQTFANDGSQHLGLDLKDIGMSGPDLLAEKLLAHGDPNEDETRRAAPPMNSTHRRAALTWHEANATASWADRANSSTQLC